jgi:hypothetical protein
MNRRLRDALVKQMLRFSKRRERMFPEVGRVCAEEMEGNANLWNQRTCRGN